MKQVFRASAVMVGAVVVGSAGMASAKTKKVSTEKYAKTLCVTLGGVSDSEQSLVDAYNALDTADAASFQQQALGIADDFVGDLMTASKKLKKTYPDVDDGKKISKQFTAYLDGAIGSVQEAADTFRAADPNGVAFSADVAVFEVAFRTLEATLGDPFNKVTDQDMLGAFKDEKACDDIVTVIGG